MTASDRVTVIGAGVSGLTTAIVLAETGIPVDVLAAEIPGPTSLAAGAMWGPYLVEPRAAVNEWSQYSLTVFRTLATDASTGVRVVSGIEASRHATAPPDWSVRLPGFQPCETGMLPPGFSSGYRFDVPLIEMSAYLNYLQARMLSAGVSTTSAVVENLGHPGLGRIVVNCAGMGARRLASDRGLRPIRGQNVVVANPGITEFFSEDTGTSQDLVCTYPHGDIAVLGGTAIDGRGDLEPDPSAADAIVRRCATIVPALASAQILSHRIGIRPTRRAVRVEAEMRPGGRVVLHNYGHGGAGVTLSWGCARSNAALAARHLEGRGDGV